MRKIIFVLVLALPLGACNPATFFSNLSTLFQASTASIANPVTPTMLYDVENGMTIAFAGLGAYKRSCIAGSIPVSCRASIGKIQAYTRQIKPYLAQLRTFVRTNDQVNAVVVYNTLMGLISGFKAEAAAANIQVQ